MALTRAQLLMGNSAQGTVLPGEVQGVKQGAGIAIAADGTITVDSQSIVGVLKLGQTAAEAAAAYNSYDWPNVTGTVGQQLTITAISGGISTLEWGDPDQIPWTAKGQLIVGTGAGTQTLQNVGADGTFLFADSATASGLNYTNTVVRTTASPTTGSAILPASTTANRPSPSSAGYIRFNTDTGKLEVYGGTSWETVPSSSTTSFVPQTSATRSAIMPTGTQAQRDGAPAAGYTRFNTGTGALEFYTGAAWSTVAASTTGAFVAQSVPGAGTASAIIFPGTTAQRQSSPAAGYMRYNTDTGFMEFYNGTAWSTVISSTSGTFVPQTVPTTGSASAQIPVGTTAQRQTVPAPAAGYLRFNTTTTLLEVFDGVSWTAAGAPPTEGLGIDITGSIVKVAIPELTAAPAAGAGAAQAVVGSLYWDTNLGVLFIYYDNAGVPTWVQASPAGSSTVAATNAEARAGTLTAVYNSPATSVPKDAANMTGAAIIPSGTSAQRTAVATPIAGMHRFNTTQKFWEGYTGAAWVPFDQRLSRVTATSLAAVANDYIVVTAATQTITLPAAPEPGACVTVVVGGTFLDTVVARNGSNIMGLAEDITLDIEYAAMQFTYTDASNGWRLN